MSTKGVATVELYAYLYVDEQGPTRGSCRIRCEAVSEFNCTLDVEELRANMAVGNVSNGYLKGGTLWMYFCNGILEVRAKRFRVSEC
jgi:hypothetical protein